MYFAAAKRLNNTIIEYVGCMEVVRVFNRQVESGKRFEEEVACVSQELFLYKLAIPEHGLGWTLFVCPMTGLFVAGIGSIL